VCVCDYRKNEPCVLVSDESLLFAHLFGTIGDGPFGGVATRTASSLLRRGSIDIARV
jgi:hypothetical protein